MSLSEKDSENAFQEKHLETLFYMIRDGVIWDGDLISKTARDDLEKLGFVVLIPYKGQLGFQTVTYAGQRAFCDYYGKEDKETSITVRLQKAMEQFSKDHPNIVPQKQ